MPLVIKVCVCGIFVFQKNWEGPGPLPSSSGSANAVPEEFLASRNFEYSKFPNSFLLFVSIEELKSKKIDIDGPELIKIDKNFWVSFEPHRSGSDLYWSSVLSTFIESLSLVRSQKYVSMTSGREGFVWRLFNVIIQFRSVCLKFSEPRCCFWNSSLSLLIHSSLLSSDSVSEVLIWTHHGSIEKTTFEYQCRVIWL